MSTSIDWRSPAYFAARRVQIEQEAVSGWPDADPPPLVTNRDPRPASAPATPRAVLSLATDGECAGWSVRMGYSRGFKRAQKIGTYTEIETFGVWASVHPDTRWRWSAMYERPVGRVSWTWVRVTIWRDANHFTDASVTDLKEFIEVHGSVLPGWFAAVTERVQAQAAKAKARPATKKIRETS